MPLSQTEVSISWFRHVFAMNGPTNKCDSAFNNIHSEAQRIQFAAETALDIYYTRITAHTVSNGSRLHRRVYCLRTAYSAYSFETRTHATANAFERFYIFRICFVVISWYKSCHYCALAFWTFTPFLRDSRIDEKNEWMLCKRVLNECEQKSDWGTGFSTHSTENLALTPLSAYGESALSFVSFVPLIRSVVLAYHSTLRNVALKNIFIYCVANLRNGLVHRSHWFEQFRMPQTNASNFSLKDSILNVRIRQMWINFSHQT